MNLTSQDIQKALGSELLGIYTSQKGKFQSTNENQSWTEWCTDSRVKTNKALFFALIGENFDAHNFIPQAYENGCRGFIVAQDKFEKIRHDEKFLNLTEAVFFVTKNTETALQFIGKASMQKLKTLKVAITGTSGKTSAKYFCHQLLEGHIPHYFSPKSFNNHIGVPFTLLDIKPEHKVALIEIGMNHPGEIKQLVDLVEPNVCLVTMVGRGHLEGVGSVEDVLVEKMSLYQQGQTHIINLDDARIFKDYQKRFPNNSQIKILKISTKDKNADVYFKITHSTFDAFEIEGHINGVIGQAKVPIAGEHHVNNIALASAVALTAGMKGEDIWKQIKNLKPVWGRSEILKSKNDVSIYFDAYNANPESMKAFLQQTQHLAIAPYFVIGEMLEMGSAAPDVHFELGQLVAQTPHQKVWFIGPSSSAFKKGFEALKSTENLMISNSYDDLLALKYKSMLQPRDWVALKASRGIGLEKFLKDFV